MQVPYPTTLTSAGIFGLIFHNFQMQNEKKILWDGRITICIFDWFFVVCNKQKKVMLHPEKANKIIVNFQFNYMYQSYCVQ